jgi:3-oxoacyl-[acyl-carrier protein] reductase
MMGSDDRINVSFDILDYDVHYLRYSVYHCDAFWRPSQLVESEWVSGFNQADITDYAQVTGAVGQVKEALGGVDILVNNAGITRDKLALRMTPEDFDAVLNVNLKGTFLMIKALYADFMKKRAGRIVNIASISGLMGNAGRANYSASKAGVVGLTKTIARELAARNVTCNAVAPGFIETPMTASMNQDALQEAMKSIPLRRMGKPEDVAEVAAFLAGDGAGYITGSVINVDGGFFMR